MPNNNNNIPICGTQIIIEERTEQEIIAELREKNKDKTLSFEEFMENYETDENLNYDDLSSGDFGTRKGFGPCTSPFCTCSNQELRQQLVETEAENDFLTRKVFEKVEEKKKSRLLSKLSRKWLLNKLFKFDVKICKLKKEKDRIQQELNTRNQTINNLTNLNQQLTNTNNNHHNQVQDLNRQIENKDREINNLRSQLSSERSKNNSLRNQIGSLEERPSTSNQTFWVFKWVENKNTGERWGATGAYGSLGSQPYSIRAHVEMETWEVVRKVRSNSVFI